MQLLWQTNQNKTHFADAPGGGRYSISKTSPFRVFSLRRDGKLLTQWPTVDAAKEAAQRHYEAQSNCPHPKRT